MMFQFSELFIWSNISDLPWGFKGVSSIWLLDYMSKTKCQLWAFSSWWHKRYSNKRTSDRFVTDRVWVNWQSLSVSIRVVHCYQFVMERKYLSQEVQILRLVSSPPLSALTELNQSISSIWVGVMKLLYPFITRVLRMLQKVPFNWTFEGLIFLHNDQLVTAVIGNRCCALEVWVTILYGLFSILGAI